MERISTFADRLAEYRKAKDMTFEQLSKITSVPAQTLNRYELGQRIPKIDAANDIADTLGLNPLWLQGFDVPMTDTIPEIVGAAAHFDISKLSPEAIEEYNRLVEYLAFKYKDEE